MNIDEFDNLPVQRQNELWIDYLKQAGIPPPPPTYTFIRWLRDQHE